MDRSPSSAAMPAQERRQAKRFRVKDCRVTFRRKRFLLLHERTEHHGLVENLSSRGFGFFTKEPLQSGEKLTVWFHVPPRVHPVTAQVKVDCEVRWCTEVGGGQAKQANGTFMDMSAGMRAELKSLLEDLLVSGEILVGDTERQQP